MSGTLFVVATPIGNLDDITARALRVLRSVAVIAAEDTRRTAHLLARYGITTKTTSFHEHNEATKAPSLVARLASGDDIALVSDAGTPTISDPGQRLVRMVHEEGFRVESVPGPSAVMASLAVSGLPCSTFTFLGFPPTRLKDRKIWFESVRGAGRTVVFFEAPHRIRETLDHLKAVIGERPVSICRELTKAHEQLVVGPISRVLPLLTEARGEFTVVVDASPGLQSEAVEVSDADLLHEFGELTAQSTFSRRKAINALARRHGKAPNVVYEALERAKKCVE